MTEQYLNQTKRIVFSVRYGKMGIASVWGNFKQAGCETKNEAAYRTYKTFIKDNYLITGEEIVPVSEIKLVTWRIE